MESVGYYILKILIIIVVLCGLSSFIIWVTEIDKQELQTEIDKIISGEYNFVDLKRDMTGKYHNQETFQVTYYTKDKGYQQKEITMEQFYDLEEQFWDILEHKIDY